VEIRDEYQTLATITLQNYFRMYEKLSGMTGTALTEASEFQKIYGLGVVPDPDQHADDPDDQRDLIYRTERRKFDAIVQDVAERHEKGQPVLIGTASVAKSEILSEHAEACRGQARGAERQAARAGGGDHRPGRAEETRSPWPPTWPAAAPTSSSAATPSSWPTISSARPASTRSSTPRSTRRSTRRFLRAIEETTAAEHEEVVEVGGLYVVGSERHESRRIDNQLRGRSGRQGDPGESRFYLSLGDDLMRLFKSDIVDGVLQALKMPDDQPIENKRVSGSIASAQSQVEAQNFEIRKNILKYDDVMNRQRHAVYGDRRKVLEGADVEPRLRATVDTGGGAVRDRGHRGFRRGLGSRAAVDHHDHPVPGVAVADRVRGARRSRPAAADRRFQGGCAGGVRPP
jgi:preprotein translocase subunit SecA